MFGLGKKRHRRRHGDAGCCCNGTGVSSDNDTVSLSSLKEGDKAEVVGFSGNRGAYRRKLLAMGFIPGTVITLKRRAPLGDPVEIGLRGYNVSLRKEEAIVLVLRRLS